MMEHDMKKILATTLLVAGSLTSMGASAAPINVGELTSDTYISAAGLDWTWAAPTSDATWGSNTLYGPDYRDGWRFATNDEFSYLKANLLSLFFDGNNNPIHSASYWNSQHSHVDVSNWLDGKISNVFGGGYYEMFYVRDHDLSPVPVPAAVWLFGSALLGFAGWARRKNKQA